MPKYRISKKKLERWQVDGDEASMNDVRDLCLDILKAKKIIAKLQSEIFVLKDELGCYEQNEGEGTNG